MTIKQHGGIFGRNPKFNEVEVESLKIAGNSVPPAVQAYDAGLNSIAGLTTVADRMIYTTASDTYAVTTLTSAGRDLLDDADAAAQRSTLGLGSIATQASDNIDIDGGAIDGVTMGVNSAITETQVDNINIDGNTISSTDTNGNIIIDADGTGKVLLNTTTSKDNTTVANGFAMLPSGSGIYSGYNIRSWASSYTAATSRLLVTVPRSSATVGGPLVKVTTTYTYRGGSAANQFGIYMITGGANATVNTVASVGSPPTVTISVNANDIEITLNFLGDSHISATVEVYGDVDAWNI